MPETIRKAYYRSLAFRCILAILLGGIATGLVLFLSLSSEPGSSYAENYAIMASMRKELFHKSMAVYAMASLFIAVGIAVISLLYSFRVAGPLYRLGVFARQIASGDLAGTVRLRRHDVIRLMDDDLNHLAAEYKSVVDRLEARDEGIQGYRRSDPRIGGGCRPRSARETLGEAG